MFFVFNKEKIQTYLVSILTVAILIVVANIDNTNAIPTSATQNYLPIYNVKTEEKNISLTINCAWNADDIDDILSILSKNNVKITFFMVGDWIDKFPEYVKKISDEGHEIRKS